MSKNEKIEQTKSITQNFWNILTRILSTSQKAESQFKKVIEQNQDKEHIDMELLFDIFDDLKEDINELPVTIDEVTTTVQTIVESIKLSRKGIKNSVTHLMDKTSQQLGKVTDATENATNNILDVTEKLMDSQADIVEKLENLKQDEEVDIDKLIEKINGNQDNTFKIMDFLQFQDITAQQIQSILSVLKETEKKLGNVLIMLSNLEGKEEEKQSLKEIEEEQKTYDEKAEFEDKKEAQKLIDDLFE